MILSLEVLQANEGDCLILHYGTAENPQIIVIDGGPSGIYNKYLKPRLLEIKDSLTVDEPLPISMVMVSHADDDHINGIVMLTNELVQQHRS
jgi:glyoxylase-like metal-dependent hydrolase (beta-lactamase superfamily II)